MPPRSSEPGWAFAVWFSVIGFFAGGAVVFLMGVLAAFPPRLSPGTYDCGTSILGGLCAMVVGAPIAAVVSAIVAGGVGALVDCVRSRLDD